MHLDVRSRETPLALRHHGTHSRFVAVRILRLCCSALRCIPLTIAAANGGRADEAVVCAEKVILVAVNAQETDGAEARVFANKLLSTHLGSHENCVLCFRNRTVVVRSYKQGARSLLYRGILPDTLSFDTSSMLGEVMSSCSV